MILPDVRGLHPFYEELALRFAERGIDALAIDWFGRTAGAERRGADFEYMPHVDADDLGRHRAPTSGGRGGPARRRRRPAPQRVFTIGFCMGGRMSFLAATLGLDLAGVIGLYGTLVGPWRNDAPAPRRPASASIGSPVLGLFGGADEGITAEHVAAFDAALDAAGVEHRIVDLPGRAAQLLRPQGRRVRRGERGRLGRDRGVRAPDAARSPSAWPGTRRRRSGARKSGARTGRRAGPGSRR